MSTWMAGDALLGAADLEVHVAVEVLEALDVDHRHPAVPFGNQAAGDAGDRRLDRTPASIRARVEPQIEPWEVEPLEERTSETTRMA